MHIVNLGLLCLHTYFRPFSHVAQCIYRMNKVSKLTVMYFNVAQDYVNSLCAIEFLTLDNIL